MGMRSSFVVGLGIALLTLVDAGAIRAISGNWEGGESPPLPRNCKRGGPTNTPLEQMLWEGGSGPMMRKSGFLARYLPLSVLAAMGGPIGVLMTRVPWVH